MTSISASDAALYLLKLRKSSESFKGFMEYYYDFKWEGFHTELQEILDRLEKGALMSAGGNPIRNLLVTMPPRHAKSTHTTINFPAYCLMRKPHREVMISSYNNELAATFGRATRDIVTDPKAVKGFTGFELSRESRAVDFWKTKAGGAYYSVGLNGTTTGRGASCLTGDAELRITTGRGATYTTTIRDVVINRIDCHVLCFDHESDSPTWGRVNAYSETPASELFEVRDSAGGVVKATGEHPFYVVGRGYVEAENLAPGDRVLRLLPEAAHQAGVRGAEVDQERAQGHVLLAGLQHEASLDEEHPALLDLRKASQAEWSQEVLQPRVQGSSGAEEKGDSRSQVPAMPGGVRVKNGVIKVLLDGLQKYAPLAIHDGGWQSKIHAWLLRQQTTAAHDQGVHESEAADQTAGRHAVRGLQVREEVACASHRPQPAELLLGQLGDPLPDVPQQASQAPRQYEVVTVSVVERIREACLVYNITVEKHENYFANGVLTHNCLMIDDPYKSREEADSATQRRKVWDFYTSGLLSRMQPDKDGQPAFQIVTQTRWHPDDMAGRIMDSGEFKRGEWFHLNYPALRKGKAGRSVVRARLPKGDPRRVPNIAVEQLERPDGQRTHAGPLLLTRRTGKATETEYYNALWPSRFPVQWLLKQRTILGDRDFEALYQQSPYVLGGNLFKEHWFKRYKMSDLPDQFHALAISVDTAFKAKTVNDYSVFTVGGITELGDIYLLKVFRLKVEFPELKKQAVRINALYRGQGLRGMWVEDAASGQVLIQELRKDTGVPVLPWKPGAADKTSRANSITPLIEGGRVYIPEEADWLDDWLTEMQTFPSGKNDDQVDGFVILMDVLSRMVVNGMQEFNAPIGQLASGKLGSDLLFSNAPLRSDPNGWRGQGSFGTALGQMPWKNWGE